ncbi:MAG: phosphate starvation-inducible protein PsiF [Pseudomonadota bacterium]|nr:phosphate starvation-inducible protein PsiF [Pseudomonadota bacterium]
MKTSILAALVGVIGLVSTSAFAIDAAAPASPAATPTAAAKPVKTTTPTTTVKPDKAEMSARAQECSKEADAKGLHGKERKHFREKCKKGEK